MLVIVQAVEMDYLRDELGAGGVIPSGTSLIQDTANETYVLRIICDPIVALAVQSN